MWMKKRQRIKLWILIAIIWLMWFSDFSFAADGSEFNLKWLWLTLNYIVSALAWIWIFFAKVAWEFLTNKRVYGEVFWRDVLLWKFRNVTKNLANFWLWFYFVYMILRWLIGQYKWQEMTKKLKDAILWVLIAWIWIQASWFFVAAIIDVSTVTLVAAWSFPSQVIAWSDEVEWSIKISLKKFLSSDGEVVEKVERITLFPEAAGFTGLFAQNYIQVEAPQDVTGVIDKLMPNADDVSGPLYFIWFSILETDLITSVNTSTETSIKATIFNTLMQWWTTIIFSIEMFVLCVIAVMRILYLWMFIVLSPLAILLRCLEKSWEKLWGDNSFLSGLTKHINFKSFFINVFKPTIIVLWIWIAAILVSLMTSVMKQYEGSGNKFSYNWVTFSSSNKQRDNSGNQWNQTYTSIMDSNLINFTITNAWKTLLWFVLSIITVILVYQIIRYTATMWSSEDFVSKNAKNIQNAMWDLIGSMPVVPVRWYDSQGVERTRFLTANKLLRSNNWEMTSPLLERKIDKYRGKIEQEYKNQGDVLNNLFNKSDIKTMSRDDEKLIENIRTNPLNKWLNILTRQKDLIGSIANKAENQGGLWSEYKGYWMTLNPNSRYTFWLTEFQKWLSEVNENEISWNKNAVIWKKMVQERKRNKNHTLENLFANTDFVRAYAELFGLRLSSDTWNELKDADISQK